MTKRLRNITLALSLASGLVFPGIAAASSTPDYAAMARTTSLSGAYLAAQIAARTNDDEAAVAYYSQGLSLDPDNEELKRLYFIALTSNGRIEEAVEIARQIKSGSEQEAVVRLVNATDAMKKGAYADVLELMKEPAGGELDQLVESVIVAWAHFGAGKTAEAQAAIAAIEGPDWVRIVADYHAGLIAAAAGDQKTALAFYGKALEAPVGLQLLPETWFRIVEASVLSHARNGDAEGAKKALQAGMDVLVTHPPFVALKKALDEGRPLGPLVAAAQAGAAEILYNIGSAIRRQPGGDVFAQGYLQLADHVSPGNDAVAMTLAAIFESRKSYERANGYYGRIKADSSYHRRAELEYALNLNDLKQVEEAKAKLSRLIEEDPADLLAYTTLGGVLAQHEEYAEAAKIYDRAIEVVGDKPQSHHWNVFYRRGIAYERLKQWDKAEPNFLKAIELSPNQADVLNYLGYSWIDQGIKLDEGLDLIRKAVELSPNRGYIIDSLGWAYYRLGRYEEAVVELERAVDLLPRDPVLNDHLGDAYWKVGRKLEATFQWNHALASEPEPADETKIREKLAKGLVDNGAKPTASSD